jgi:hypothetical protein
MENIIDVYTATKLANTWLESFTKSLWDWHISKYELDPESHHFIITGRKRGYRDSSQNGLLFRRELIFTCNESGIWSISKVLKDDELEPIKFIRYPRYDR